MRRRTALVLACGATSAALVATGFPLRLGLTRSEAAISLPGDLVIPVPTLSADRSILINAPARRIWPQLMALGKDRAGFPGLAAGTAPASTSWAMREVGDLVPITEGITLRVAVCEPFSALVLTSKGGEVTEPELAGIDVSWTLALLPESNGKTRLHLRERYEVTDMRTRLALTAATIATAVASRVLVGSVRSRVESAPTN